MDQETIQIWGVVGTWVAGIGTVSAVIVSLWLAYHQGRIKLKIWAGHRIMIQTGMEGQTDYCMVNVVNTGFRPVYLTSLGWEAGWFRKKQFVQVFGTPGNDDVPKLLKEGEETKFMLPFRLNGDEEDWIIRFPQYLAGKKGKRRYIKSLRCIVATSVGETFKVKVEKGLIEKLLESYEANK